MIFNKIVAFIILIYIHFNNKLTTTHVLTILIIKYLLVSVVSLVITTNKKKTHPGLET